MKAALIISHGSRLSETKEEVEALIQKLKEKDRLPIIKCAFLELESPDIPGGIDLCVEEGATEIIILLNFLNSGRHVNADIPRIIAETQKKHPQVEIKTSQPVGQHPKIVDLFLDMME